MIIINMQYFGDKGSSSGKSGGAAGGRAQSLQSLKDEIYQNHKQKSVQLKDKYGDYTGETHTGFVGKNNTLVSVRQVDGGFVLDVGDTTRGFVATIRLNGKPMTEAEAWEKLKSYL